MDKLTRKSIVVVGSSNADMIITLDRLPRPGETIIGGEFTVTGGGKGANQAVAAARAGGSVAFIGRVGRDDVGNQALESFRRDGVNVEFVVQDSSASSGVAFILVGRDGQNSIAVASGANAKLTVGEVKKARKAFANADVLLAQLETPLEAVETAIELAVNAGMRVILNPAPACLLPDKLLRRVWLLTPNELEAELLSGIKVKNEITAAKAAKALVELGPRNVIVTLGAKGAVVACDGHTEVVPGFKVPVLDTTGAGDVFNGALAVALCEGFSIPAAARFANAAAALSVSRLGAQVSAPKRAEIEPLYRSRLLDATDGKNGRIQHDGHAPRSTRWNRKTSAPSIKSRRNIPE